MHPSPMRFRGVTFEKTGHKGARIHEVFDVPWTDGDILSVLGHSDALDKLSQQLWAAARYLEGHRRGMAGLDVLYAAVLDCDCADVGEYDRVKKYLHSRGLAFVMYTSWSHGDPEKVHIGSGRRGPFDTFRVVLPYSRPVTADEHRVLVPGLFGHEVPENPAHYDREVAGKYITAENGRESAASARGWDPASARPAQAYFLPSSRSDIDVYLGAPVDVEAVLQRPFTARVSSARQRPYLAPDKAAVGALGRVERALGDMGLTLGPERFQGWRRACCPSCAPNGQRSPSFTCRANGDGVDFMCHAHCTRAQILEALKLSPLQFRAPSHLQLRWEEQLDAQKPSEEVELHEATIRLERDLREALRDDVPTVLKYCAGTGKSRAASKVMAELARNNRRVAYATQEHAVAAETRRHLAHDAPEVVTAHVHSPLIRVEGEPVCQRADELKERVFDYGASLFKSVCPRCPFFQTCPARIAAQTRSRAKADAQVLFCSHSGISQVFDENGQDLRLIVDEMPTTFEQIEVSREAMFDVSMGPLSCATLLTGRAAKAIATAWLAGVEPSHILNHEGTPLSVDEVVSERGRLSLVEGPVRDDERTRLKAADALIRMYAFRLEGGTIHGLGPGSKASVGAMVPQAAHTLLLERRGVLLSATPVVAALPGFRVRECRVRDGARVYRKMVLRADRGSMALQTSFFDSSTRTRTRRERGLNESAGINWPAVDTALARARLEAQKYSPARVLFVTFKFLADALRADPVRLGNDVEVAHFGATRGKNDWMEGKPAECSVVYLFGTPRMGVMSTLVALGFRGDAADQAWVQHAAAELTQAEGRLRLPRRTKPCTVFCEGDVAPMGWHHGNVDEVILEGPLDEAFLRIEAERC